MKYYELIKDTGIEYSGNLDKRDEVVELNQFVDITRDGKNYTVRLSDIPKMFGFNKEYSLKEKYPEIENVWSEKNERKPEDIFYLEDESIILNLNDTEKIVHLQKDRKFLENKKYLNKKKYNFLNEEGFINLVEDVPIKIYPEELISRYRNLINYFNNKQCVENINSNNIVYIDENDLRKFYKDVEGESNYSKIGFLVVAYNCIYKLLNLDIRASYDDFELGYSVTKYITKDEMIKYCDMMDDVQISFILYSCFLGLGDNKFEIMRNLKMNMIDEDEKVIRYEDKIIPVDDKFIELATECNELVEYKRINKKSRATFVLNPLSEYILKPRKQANNNDGCDPMASISIRVLISFASDYFFGNGIMNKTYLHKSGILSRMNEIEKKTGIVWNTSNVLDKKNGLLFTFNSIDMIRLYELNYKRKVE